MRTWPTLIFCILYLWAATQPLPDRYRTEVFGNWIETTNILFSDSVPQPTPGGGFYELITGLPLNADETETEPVDLYMNIFQPAGDTLANRPAIVICFGGGFLTGSKDHWSIRLLGQELAKRGFVTAVIDYRLGMNIFDQDLAARAVYRGIQDGRAAVKYLRANAATYGIDPDEVYIGGHSAGAFIALHNLYLDMESERPVSTFQWMQDGEPIPDLGCLDCTGIATGFSGHADAAFSLAGAIGFLSYLETADDGRTALFHSEDDDTVPYDTGEPFSNITGLVIGSDLPVVYGSLPISLRCDTLMLPYIFYSYTDRGHGVHEDDNMMLYLDIVPAIGDWFYEQRLKPEVHPLQGRDFVCDDELMQIYSVNQSDAVYFDWQVTGGTFTSQSPTSNIVVVQWSDTATIRTISVTPYSEWLARGETQEIDVATGEYAQNNWLGGSGSWTDPGKWSLGHIPERCEDVFILNAGPEITVDIPDGMLVEVRSIFAVDHVLFEVGEGAELRLEIEW